MVNVDELLGQVVSLISNDDKKTQTGGWQGWLQSMMGNPTPKPASAPKPVSVPDKSTLENAGFQNPIRGTYYCTGIFGVGDENHKGIHDGVDLRVIGGTSVYPITDGIVTNVGAADKGGNLVKIKHPNVPNIPNFTTTYLHLGTISVYPNQHVDKNTVIGTVGDSGNAEGTYPHIHFETRINGKPVDPADYILVPPYTLPKDNKDESKEKWLLDEDEKKARSFDVSRHLANQNRKSLANKIDQLEKIADAYYSITKSLY